MEAPFDVTKIHTTPAGEERIKRNLHLSEESDAVAFCYNILSDETVKFERKGKNWYATAGGCRITINASSLSIITAHQLS